MQSILNTSTAVIVKHVRKFRKWSRAQTHTHPQFVFCWNLRKQLQSRINNVWPCHVVKDHGLYSVSQFDNDNFKDTWNMHKNVDNKIIINSILFASQFFNAFHFTVQKYTANVFSFLFFSFAFFFFFWFRWNPRVSFNSDVLLLLCLFFLSTFYIAVNRWIKWMCVLFLGSEIVLYIVLLCLCLCLCAAQSISTAKKSSSNGIFIRIRFCLICFLLSILKPRGVDTAQCGAFNLSIGIHSNFYLLHVKCNRCVLGRVFQR